MDIKPESEIETALDIEANGVTKDNEKEQYMALIRAQPPSSTRDSILEFLSKQRDVDLRPTARASTPPDSVLASPPKPRYRCLVTLDLVQRTPGGVAYWVGEELDHILEQKVPGGASKTKRGKKNAQSPGRDKARALILGLVRVRHFCVQVWTDEDVKWVLGYEKHLVEVMGGVKEVRRIISRMVAKVVVNVHNSVEKLLKHKVNVNFSDQQVIEGELEREDIIIILGTGYANSIQIPESQWARKVASWHLYASNNHQSESSRREAVNTFINNQMTTTEGPNLMTTPLYYKFAAKKRETRPYRDVAFKKEEENEEDGLKEED